MEENVERCLFVPNFLINFYGSLIVAINMNPIRITVL